MNSNLYYQCNIYKVFGAHTFGQTHLIQKEFYNLPSHIGVEVSFDLLKMDSWDNEKWNFYMDGTSYYSNYFGHDGNDWCGDAPNYFGNNKYNEKFYPVLESILHTNSTLTLAFQSNLDSVAYDESYGIQNLRVYLIKDCDPNCLSCSSTNSTKCTSCPYFAAINTKTGRCECRFRFYMETSDFTHCEECDISCFTCDGPTSLNCTSCFFGDILLDGVCISSNCKCYFIL